MTIKMRISLALKALACFAIIIHPARGDVISTFDTNVDGWSVVSFSYLAINNYNIVGTYGASYHASEGNPGGYISSIDPDGGDFTFAAPAKFLGDISTATGLSYDIIRMSGGVDYQTTDVILVGAGQRLLWKQDPALVPNDNWTTVNVSFSPSVMWHVGTTTGAEPTIVEFQSVLGDLTGLYIRGEYYFTSERTGIDSIRLLASEPSADFDFDGDIDGRDFLIWQRGFGLTEQEDNSLGDADFDGTIDGEDLEVWQEQYGTDPLIAASIAVPEPGTLVLLLGGLLVFERRRVCAGLFATRGSGPPRKVIAFRASLS